jgi:type VI secretion system protein ImpJ
MKPAKPVLWYQGLFLQPQHFQQFDLYVQSLLTPLFGCLQPFFWGVSRLEIREETLKELTFDIAHGEILFPDGTWVVIPENTAVFPRTFRKEEMEAGKTFRVHLGLRKWDPVRENAAIRQNDETGFPGTRFVSPADDESLRDLHRGGPEAPVKLMQYALRVFTGSETADLSDYQTIPVAEVQYDGSEIRLGRTYVPPLITLAGSDAIRQIIQNIREQALTHSRRLEEYKSTRDVRVSDMDAGYLLFLLALRSLNRYVPLLQHFAEAPNLHPWTVYGLLRQMVGELSAFTERVNALGELADGTPLLPEYDHSNPLFCFSEAQTLIGELLAAIVIGPESIIHLERTNNIFTAPIPPEFLEGGRLFYLVLRTAESRSRVIEAQQNIMKVSSAEYMRTLIGRALPGITLEYYPAPPPGVPNRPNTFYFRIDQDHPQWVEIRKNQNIALSWEQAPKDTKAEIIVLRK